jgi:hypothetical protein
MAGADRRRKKRRPVSMIPAPTVEVLQYAGVPKGQTASPIGRLIVLLAQRYGLDPALKHVEVIPARGGLQVYVTADGWRYIADRSGELDGITFPDVSQGETGWRATVHVWRKGCAHPFEGRAGAGRFEGKVELADPEAVAITRATRRALKNGFASQIRVEGEYQAVYADDTPPEVDETALPLPRPVPITSSRPVDVPPRRDTPPRAQGAPADQAAAHRAIGELPPEAQEAFLAAHSIADFGSVWSGEAVQAALELAF